MSSRIATQQTSIYFENFGNLVSYFVIRGWWLVSRSREPNDFLFPTCNELSAWMQRDLV